MSKEIIADEHFRKIANLTQAKVFLGREFLTWIWYLAEEQSKLEIELPHSDKKFSIELWIDDRILLESSGGTSHENLIKGGSPSHSQEATAALWEGKTVKDLKLGIRIDGIGDFIANLNCTHLVPKTLQLPVAENEESEIDTLTSRIRNTNLYLNILDGLFLMFVKERTDKRWEDTGAQKIQLWIKNRSKKTGDLLH